MRKIDKLVIHHTADSIKNKQTVDSIRKIHLNRGYADIGYHKVIDNDGVIRQGRPDERNGAHCYNRYEPKSQGVNSTSIGITVAGNFEYEQPTDIQIASLKHTCLVLCKRYNINPEHIYGHRDFMATACPGKNLYIKLSEIREYVKENM